MRRDKTRIGTSNQKKSSERINLSKNNIPTLTGILSSHCKLDGHSSELGITKEDESAYGDFVGKKMEHRSIYSQTCPICCKWSQRPVCKKSKVKIKILSPKMESSLKNVFLLAKLTGPDLVYSKNGSNKGFLEFPEDLLSVS